MSAGKDLLEYLKEFHTTEGTAVKSRDLRALFNLTDKQVRNVVTVLRQNGEPVCSSSYGYWYSNDPEDINRTIHRLGAQVINMNVSIKGLKKALEVKDDENGKEETQEK